MTSMLPPLPAAAAACAATAAPSPPTCSRLPPCRLLPAAVGAGDRARRVRPGGRLAADLAHAVGGPQQRAVRRRRRCARDAAPAGGWRHVLGVGPVRGHPLPMVRCQRGRRLPPLADVAQVRSGPGALGSTWAWVSACRLQRCLQGIAARPGLGGSEQRLTFQQRCIIFVRSPPTAHSLEMNRWLALSVAAGASRWLCAAAVPLRAF